MTKKFAALAEFRQAQLDTETHAADARNRAEGALSPQTGSPKGRGRPAGKRSNPDYEPTTVLLRKKTKRRASRLLEDTDSNYDLSELIESLLNEWISRLS